MALICCLIRRVTQQGKKKHESLRTEGGADLVVVRVLQQSVVQNNALVLEEAVKVGVRVAGTLASVNDKELGQREADTTGQSLDHSAEFTLRERVELVEERLNEGGEDRHHDKLEYHPRFCKW